MPRIIPNTTSQADYNAATIFGGSGIYTTGFVNITGSALCLLRLYYGRQGQAQFTDDIVLAPGTYALLGTEEQPLAGLAVKDFIGGNHVQFSGALFGPKEVAVIAGSPANASVSSSGTVTPIAGVSQLGYVEFSAPVTISATTELTANTIVALPPLSFDGLSTVLLEFQAPECVIIQNAAGNRCFFVLFDDTGSGAQPIGQLGSIRDDSGNNQIGAPIRLSREFPPANGSHTFSVRAYRSNANATVNAGAGGAGTSFPGYLRATLAV